MEYSLLHSAEMAVIQANSMVIDSMSGVKKVIDRGLLAKKRDRDGKLVHDISLQLKTVETLRGFAEMGQPKTPAFQLNQQFNSGGTQQPAIQGGGSFEARLRLIREQKGLENGDMVDARDAEYVDDEQTVEDELSDIGVDIDEDDDEQ
jgi:hypothetical protein